MIVLFVGLAGCTAPAPLIVPRIRPVLKGIKLTIKYKIKEKLNVNHDIYLGSINKR